MMNPWTRKGLLCFWRDESCNEIKEMGINSSIKGEELIHPFKGKMLKVVNTLSDSIR